MCAWARIAGLAAAVAGAPAAASADPLPPVGALARDDTVLVRGTVERAESRWSGSAIITESTIRTDTGDEVDVVQLGGSVGDVGMRVSHSPPVLDSGWEVQASLRSARTELGDAQWTLDDAVPVTASDDSHLPYVRTMTEADQTPVEWTSGCIHIAYHEDGTSHLEGNLEFAIMDEVLETWEDSTETCSYLEFVQTGFTRQEVGFDGVNLIKFREDRWCRPPSGNDPEICYSPSAAAITTLFFVDDPGSSNDGEIIDGDIEMNAVDFAVSADGETEGDQSCMSDLANTLTHEVGHLIGLDHTCWDGQGPRPEDDEGEPVPSCSQGGLPSEVTEATMYAFQDCGETKKAELTLDDIAGKCGIYPLGYDPGVCEPVPVGGCCSLSAAGAADEALKGGAITLLSGALALAALRRRARARVSEAPT